MQIKVHLAQQGSSEDEGRRSALWRIQELRQRRRRKENEIAVEPERIQPDLQAHRPARRASEDSGTDWRRPWRWKMRQSCGRKGSSRRLPSSSLAFLEPGLRELPVRGNRSGAEAAIDVFHHCGKNLGVKDGLARKQYRMLRVRVLSR